MGDHGPGLPPGGWAFEFANDNYPDVDDTAVLPLALHGMGIGEEDAIRRGVDWLVGMQSRGGGWGAFDVDNSAMWLYKVPFCDFGKVTDEPSADVTAHSLEALGRLGTHRGAAERGVDWLLSEQEDDGSWFGRWGVNHIYGTGAALPGLEACGVPHDHPSMRRAVAWLERARAICIAVVSGTGAPRKLVSAVGAQGVELGWLDGGLATSLRVAWTVELLVAPAVPAASLMALRERIAR